VSAAARLEEQWAGTAARRPPDASLQKAAWAISP